ncbi:competence protein [Sphingobacterium faecium NBRC 15299]|uniref:ComEC/Rec2 family competence protein n=1 Tax=Sphingobacterium faecium TaxID=34087 RepID=UPI000D35119F|nr:ComEC/Rec2 family competence protein [Sphingobacterium faecium]PTX09016.1 competence protein ComEC [Sphingobacterium faecium]GEM65012.1 competence protein [Sphingobacterium faecium NBRC 15299]
MRTNFYEQMKKVPFLKFLFFYGLGIWVANASRTDDSRFIIVQLLLVFSVVIHFIFFFQRSRLGVLFMINGYFMLSVFGIWNIWRTYADIDRAHFYGKASEQLVGIVDDEPIVKNGIVRFPVKVLAQQIGVSFRKATGKLMMTIVLDSTTLIRYGDELMFVNKIQQIPTSYNPLEFDYKNYLMHQGIHAQIFLNAHEYKTINHNKGNDIKAFALQIRKNLVDKFKKYVADEESFQIAVALIVGYRTMMSSEVIHTFSNTGTIHVLSVSGMHVGIVFLFLMWILQQLNGNYTFNFFRLVLLLLSIWAYTILTGMAPSILRAAIMLSFFLISRSMQREANMLNTMASSAFVLLLLEPNMLFDIGFQLSYCAVLGIVLLFPLFKCPIFLDGSRLGRIVWDSTMISLSAQIMTAPLALFYFGQFPNYFLIANVLVIVPVTMIMYIGIGMLFIPFDLLNVWLGNMMQWCIQMMFQMLKFLDQLPYATWTGIVFSPLMVLVSIVVILMCSYAWYWKNKSALYCSTIFLFVLIILFSYQQYVQLNYSGFRIYNTRKEITLAFINKSKVTLISSYDSLNSRNLVYSVNRDLTRFSNWKDIDFVSLASIDSLRTNRLIQKSNFTVQILEHGSPTVQPTDLLLVRKNSKWNFIDHIKLVQPKLVLFDGTSTDANIRRWEYQLDSLGVAHYSIKNNFAYVWDKELL